ncbi:MAG: hypothetical protein VCC02_06860 [Myxococcota bacterium]|jgi:transcriptional regulator with XRE-family HTH domain
MPLDFESPVAPNGNAIRRLRFERGWAPEHLITAIGEASARASGVSTRLTPNHLVGIEERNERVPYDLLCWIASGLDCDPLDIVLDEPEAGFDA